jgi:hypothetical protein
LPFHGRACKLWLNHFGEHSHDSGESWKSRPAARAPLNTAGGSPLEDEGPHRASDDLEEVYYEGSPLLRGEMSTVLLYGLIGAVLIAIPLLVRHYEPTWHLPLWVMLVFFGLGVISLLIPVFVARSVRYRITNYRIDYERGMLSKNIDTLELWHVEDLSFHQSLWGRITGVGTIRIISHDDVNPTLMIRSVPNSRHLFETLKQRVIAVKRQRGVIKMDTGS